MTNTKKEIIINFMQHRRDFRRQFIYFMNRLKPENKDLIKIVFSMTDNLDFSWMSTDIEIEIVNFGGNLHVNNYYDKFMYSLNQNPKYYIILGEDLFMSNHVWDYIIENRNIVDDDNILALTPAINIGVPSCDFFMEDFCTQEQIERLHKIFLQVNFTETCAKRWGIYEYEKLNDFTIRTDHWDTEGFHKALATVNTEVKGVHPVRFSLEAQQILCDIVVNNVKEFIKKQDYSIITPFRPYLCNEVSLMRADILHKIHQTIGFHPYDELSFNQYRRENNLTYAFIKKGYALHTLFAYVSRTDPSLWNQMAQYEQYLHDIILKKAQEYNHFDLPL